jgi:hypothetical protein
MPVGISRVQVMPAVNSPLVQSQNAESAKTNSSNNQASVKVKGSNPPNYA